MLFWDLKPRTFVETAQLASPPYPLLKKEAESSSENSHLSTELIPEYSTVIRKRCKVKTKIFQTRLLPVKRGRLVVLMTIERQSTYEGDTILLRLVKPLEYSGITTSYLEERIVKDASNFFILFLVKTDYCEE